MFMFVVGIGFFVGIVVGWAWKPRWGATLLNCLHHPSSLDLGSAGNMEDIKKKNAQQPLPLLTRNNPNCSPSSSSIVEKEEKHDDDVVVPRDEDLKHLWHLVERKDGGVAWKHMMDRSTHTMHYQAWQRDPQPQPQISGPPEYCSKTVYENATPQLMRDFLWDDDFRLKWDHMLIHAATLHEFPTTGSTIVHWIRKFPFFCSDREYTISRRMWELEGSYYCVTKGVPCPSIPRKQKPLRVDLYYSSWFIQSVESKIGNHPACEVTFFHHEDMKIPWEIAKFGVRQGMWGAAKKVERGFRCYQKERAISKSISLHVVMAQMCTKIDKNHLPSSSLEPNGEDLNLEKAEAQVEVRQQKPMVPKLLVIGGAIMVASSIDSGLLTKAVIFGIAKRFASIGRQPCPVR